MFKGGAYSAARRAARWNARYAGKEAFTHRNRDGYRVGAIDGIGYLAHRVIWKMTTGEDPVEVDHKDQDQGNNKKQNLRNVSSSINCRNRAVRAVNSSGVVGVYQRGDKFVARIKLDQKARHLGTFGTKEAAVAARKWAEVTNGFSSLHGGA